MKLVSFQRFITSRVSLPIFSNLWVPLVSRRCPVTLELRRVLLPALRKAFTQGHRRATVSCFTEYLPFLESIF
jgi:hypothetical protein